MRKIFVRGRLSGSRILALLFCVFVLASRGAAQLSERSQASVLTISPGDPVYTTFGHSAIRVSDPTSGLDRCYNYGTFDFEQPGFLLKFCRGKLNYFLDTEPFRYTERGALLERRVIDEQVLNFTLEERQRLYELLETNALEANRYYLYDFFYDNCATRIRDIIKKSLGYHIVFDSTHIPYGFTMRQLLHTYLTEKPWTRFGIDLVLGIPADRRALAEEFMFLPDYMRDMFAHTRMYDGRPLVSETRRIPDGPANLPIYRPGFYGRPMCVMLSVALVGLLSLAHPRASRIFDGVFWFVLGLAGLLMFSLWFFTDHQPTRLNLNLLWALPTHLFMFWRKPQVVWVENYYVACAVLGGIFLLLWPLWPQQLPPEAIPLAGLVVVKSFWRIYKRTRFRNVTPA